MKKVTFIAAIAILSIAVDLVFYVNKLKRAVNIDTIVENAMSDETESKGNCDDDTSLELFVNYELFVNQTTAISLPENMKVKTISVCLPIDCLSMFSFIKLPINIIIYIYTLYALIRIIIDIKNKRIFRRINVNRVRIITYSNIAMAILDTIYKRVLEHCVTSQISIQGFEVLGLKITPHDFVTYLLLILFAEVFAAGIRIKEEQDLTI